MTTIDPEFEFDCPRYYNFAASNDDSVSDSWFEQQRLNFIEEEKKNKQLLLKGRKGVTNIANKENAGANTAQPAADVKQRKTVRIQVEERVPLSSRQSTKPNTLSTARQSIKGRPSVSSQKTPQTPATKARPSVTATPKTRPISRPSVPAASTRTLTTSKPFITPQHRRAISTPAPVSKPIQQSMSVSHQRSRSVASVQPTPQTRPSTRPSVAVVAPPAVATTVRSTAPLTRPAAINFATDSRAAERAAKEKQRTTTQTKSISAPVTARVPARSAAPAAAPQQPRQRTLTRCEPFKLSTNERKRKPVPSAPATPPKASQTIKRARPMTAAQASTQLGAPTPAKSQPYQKPLTSPSPFPLRSVIRHEAYQARLVQQLEAERQAEIEAKKFHAPPLEQVRHVLTASPFVPTLEHVHTEPEPISFNCEVRASARRAWEEMQRAQEEEQAEIERKRTAERARSAAAELAALRQTLIHHPLQVPSFQHVFHPQPSSQPLTEARSPVLQTKVRAAAHFEKTH